MNTHPSGAAPVVVPDDDDEEDILLDDEEEWEDRPMLEVLKQTHEGWYITKLARYSPKILTDLADWCSTNCRGQWKKEGWHTGCSYTVVLLFEDPRDAVFYRLRWSDTVA